MAVNSRAQKIELLISVNSIFIFLHNFHIATTKATFHGTAKIATLKF